MAFCQVRPGYRCNVTSDADLAQLFSQVCDVTSIDSHQITGKVAKCVQCFIENHCLANNTCEEGTTGPSCERCLHDHEMKDSVYHSLGSLCLKCDSLPIGAIVTLAFWLLVVASLLVGRFRSSCCLKIRQFINFGQLVVFTFGASVAWPRTAGNYLKYFGVTLGTTYPFNLECYLDFYHFYTEWAASIVLPTLGLCLLAIHSAVTRRRLAWGPAYAKKVVIYRGLTRWRRLLALLLLMWYAPLARSTLQANACVSNIPKDLSLSDGEDEFLYDQRHTCDEIKFQALNFICTVCLLLFVFTIPLLLLFTTLRFRKWHLLDENRARYGSIYDAYNSRGCFWETVILVRKLLYLLLTEIYPLGGLIQTACMLGLTVVYLFLFAIIRPFNPCSYKKCRCTFNINVFFEVVSSLFLIMLQVLGLIIALRRYVDVGPYMEPLTWFLLGLALVVTLLWMSSLFAMPAEEDSSQDSEIVPEGSDQDLHLRDADMKAADRESENSF